MSPASVDIKDVLVENGVGKFVARRGWGIYVAQQPAEPDNVITIYDAPGRQESDQSRGTWVSFVRVFVRVRAQDYLDGFRKMQEILSILKVKDRFEKNDTEYLSLRDWSAIEPDRMDDKERWEWILNFEAVTTPAQ